MSKSSISKAASLMGRKGYQAGLAKKSKSFISSVVKKAYKAFEKKYSLEQRIEWRRMGAKARWAKAKSKAKK